LFCILAITLANLRGVKESGAIFAFPTYFFIFSFIALIAVGFYRYFFGSAVDVHEEVHYPQATQTLTYFLVLRAFSSGCAALTGVEAISNGVPAFQKPESRNANITLILMGLILLTLFLGITELARFYHVLPKAEETVVSQLARQIFEGGPFYYTIQAATAMILILAANTSFADFPRLASLLARDGYMPRQLSLLGDRLAFSNGIILLGFASGLLVVLFQANTHRLIPLYAVGVFASFTLSQSGMVLHWIRLKGKGWWHRVIINGVGAVTTLVTLLVIASTKFTHGAWMVIVFIPLVIAWFLAVHHHYRDIVDQLHPDLIDLLPPKLHRVLIPVSTFHKGTAKAISYSLSISDDVRAVYVALDPDRARKIQDIWRQWCIDIPLVILDSPYRSIIRPLVDYIDALQREEEDQLITVILPEFVAARWWQQILHNQTALLIRGVLMFKRGVTVTSVRHFLTY
jgi:amino acid transporter